MGTVGYSGDGGPATAALLNSPGMVAIDGAGTVFIPDNGNNCIRKIAASGVITTIAGNGTAGYGGDGGPASAALLSQPWAIITDGAGGLYFTEGNDIRQINAAGVISTIAGIATNPGYSGDGCAATAALLNGPAGLTMDGAGNIYFADQGNNRVRKLSRDATPRFTGGHSQGITLCLGRRRRQH